MTETEEPTIDIRKMRDDDVEPAMEILGEWDMAPKTDDKDAERSTIRVDNSFVAEEVETDTVVGTASFIVHSETLGETASLAVDPEYRGEGIGYRLQVARLEEMRSRGIETVRTETDRPETIEWYVENFGPHVNLFVDNSRIVELECMRSGLWGKATTWGRVVSWKGDEE